MKPLLFSTSLVSLLGWTFVHFLWQGAAIALAYAVAQWTLRRSSANARYLAGCLALAVMVLAPALTLGHLRGQTVILARPVPRPVTQTISLPPEAIRTEVPQPAVSLAAQPQPRLQPTVSAKSIPRPAQPMVPKANLNRLLPWIVAAWGLGVLLLTLHFLVSWLQVRRIKGRATLASGEIWCSRLVSLRHKLAVSRPVRLLQSACVEVPTVIGYLSPVILVPASALTGLTTQQLELLLAHELAHIRRHDYLVNALQNIVEILLFYHPAVWWISRRVREEREHCCDDLAVATCGDRLEYVRALATMEELRGLSPAWTIGAQGGSLVQRVRRLLRAPDPSPNPAGWWITGFAILILVIGLGGTGWNSAVAKDTPESSSDATTAGWSRTLNNGVKVELVGIARSPLREGQAWWKPDGLLLRIAPVDTFSRGSEEDATGAVFALRLSDTNAGVVGELRAEGFTDSLTRAIDLEIGRPMPNVLLFREAKNVIMTSALRLAREQLAKAESHADAAEKLAAEVQASLETTPPELIPQIANDKYIQELRARLASEEADLARLHERYRDKYPLVVEKRSQIQELRQSIGQAATNVLGSIATEAVVSRAQFAAIKAEVRFLQEKKPPLVLSLQDGRWQGTSIHSCDLRVGIASAPWENRLNLNLGTRTAARSDFELQASDSVEIEGETTVTLTLARCSLQTRLVALDLEGKEHEAAITGQSGSTDSLQTIYRFHLPPKQIRHYSFQARPCEWVEFRNVALAPLWLHIEVALEPNLCQRPPAKPEA